MTWIKRIPIHPVLLGLYPIFALIAHNVDQIHLRETLRSLGVAILGLIVWWLVLRWIIRDIEDENASNELQWACSRSARTELRNVTSRSLKVKHDHISSIRKQMALSKAFSALSPVAAFTYIATDLANTGIHDERHFRRTVDIFKNEFVAYVGEKLASRKFLDRPNVSDMPSFQYKPLNAFAIARDDLIHLLMLALFSIVFFLCAHLSFLRYDVR